MSKPGWIDTAAPANGIGPICKFCHFLIDLHPIDHQLHCPAREGSHPGPILEPRRPCWDCHWMQRVMANGAMSTCVTRKVGGVLVLDNRARADGFNGNLPGHPHCDEGGCERCNDPHVVSGVGLERCVCVHCEQNVVSYCAQHGISMADTSLYLPATPCVDCAKLVIACGVRELVYVEPYPGAEAVVREFAHLSGVTVRKPHCRCGQRLWEH